MKSTWLIGIAVISLSVTAAAQNTPAPAAGNQSPTSASSKEPAANGQTTVLTVTGCVQRAERPSASGAPRSAGEPGTSGGAATGIRNDAEQFTLGNITNRVITGNASSASAVATGAESSYLLQGQTEDLRAHVGHQVEITAMRVAMPPNNQGDVRPGTAVGTSGTAAPASSPVAGAAATTGTPETAANPDTAKSSTAAAASGATMPAALMVQSVRMLAASCEPAKP